VSSTEVTVRGDLRGTAFAAGLAVPSLFVFSRQHVRGGGEKQDGAPVLGGRLQLRTLRIFYNDSGYFRVEVTPLYRETNHYPFTGRLVTHGANVLGAISLASGAFQVPVLSRAEQTTIAITSDSFLPFHFVNAEWEGFYHIRSTRL
jgi:hypothetical protein